MSDEEEETVTDDVTAVTVKDGSKMCGYLEKKGKLVSQSQTATVVEWSRCQPFKHECVGSIPDEVWNFYPQHYLRVIVETLN